MNNFRLNKYLLWNARRYRSFRFNPRTCEGATNQPGVKRFIMTVSIHAPVRVRRLFSGLTCQSIMVSIHAPVRVRRSCGIDVSQEMSVSIHAPVRVRHNRMRMHRTCSSFNPRTCEGATVKQKKSSLKT